MIHNNDMEATDAEIQKVSSCLKVGYDFLPTDPPADLDVAMIFNCGAAY